jgi:hypothetical protein
MADGKHDHEHPAVQAARILKELHEQTIATMDKGGVFEKSNDDGTVENVNNKMRAECEKQIAMCDKVIEAGALREMGRSDEAAAILDEIKKLSGTIKLVDTTTGTSHELGSTDLIPEIGDFDHDRPSQESTTAEELNPDTTKH